MARLEKSLTNQRIRLLPQACLLRRRSHAFVSADQFNVMLHEALTNVRETVR
jgi:hypothetical protein